MHPCCGSFRLVSKIEGNNLNYKGETLDSWDYFPQNFNFQIFFEGCLQRVKLTVQNEKKVDSVCISDKK